MTVWEPIKETVTKIRTIHNQHIMCKTSTLEHLNINFIKIPSYLIMTTTMKLIKYYEE